MKPTLVLAGIYATLVAARPTNNWNEPCFQGRCAYDLPASAESGPGTLVISGSPDAITDITPASGWVVLDCDPNWLAQDIRLVCKSDNMGAAGCDHLFQGLGPADKIVRLPEGCGKNAFARISKSWVSRDQFISPSRRSQILYRDDVQPQVQAIRVDTNFAVIDAAKNGAVSFTFLGANIPGAEDGFTATAAVALQGRDDSNFVEDALKEFADWSIDKQQELPVISVTQGLTLFNQHLDCGPIGASLDIDVSCTARVRVVIGVAASGTIVPPRVEDFGACAEITGDIGGNLTLSSTISGTLDTGNIPLYEIGIPGLEFPGIFKIGPSFQVHARAKTSLSLGVALDLGLNYQLDKAQLFFPPSKGTSSGGDFKFKDTALTLSATPSITAKGTVEGHLIPRLHLGITGLQNQINAGIYLELDTSTTLELTGTVSTSIDPKAGRSYVPPYGASATRSTTGLDVIPANSQKSLANPESTNNIVAREPDPSFTGCVGLKTGLAVNTGTEGKLFGLLEVNAKLTLYSKYFEFYKKCFGSGANKARTVSPLSHRSLLDTRWGDLTCPQRELSKSVYITSENVEVNVILADREFTEHFVPDLWKYSREP